MKKLLMISILALVAAPAFAAGESVSGDAKVSFTAPTTDTNGAALTGANSLVKFQLFASNATIPDGSSLAPVVDNVSPAATSISYTFTAPNGSTQFFRVKACSTVCSLFSGQVSKQIAVSVPNAPTGVNVTVTVTVSTGP